MEAKKITVTLLGILVVISIIITIIYGAIYSISKEKENADSLCKIIALKKELQFLQSIDSKCEWTVNCEFQCRLLNKNGEVVVINYP